MTLNRRLFLFSFIMLVSCSDIGTSNGGDSPRIVGPSAEAAYRLIQLADRGDTTELAERLRRASYYNWIEGEPRPSGRPAMPDDVFKSAEGPCNLGAIIEYNHGSALAEWTCNAYDIELSLLFRFDLEGRLVELEREVPRWVTEV